MINEKISLNGTHLMLDCFGCDKNSLDSMEQIYNFLDKLPDLLGMKKFIKPFVVRYEGGAEWDKGGLGGFVFIAESHISIHTFPSDGFFTADVYSCKPFDVKKAVLIFKTEFGAKSEKVKVIPRDIEIIRAKNLEAFANSNGKR